MNEHQIYSAGYSKSHALIIGIDRYYNASTLEYAANDAKAIAQVLIDRFHFTKENVKLLLDKEATRNAITHAFLSFTNTSLVGKDDRVFVFFAGHGHTARGRRGETGFLVPVDGKIEDLATLVRWDELTRNADLIVAKHILFLMDACYGGLALSRKIIPPGSMRLLTDMLQRSSRQVLTAGKADEEVSDGGGTRLGHSIFTSHLLDGLEGAASASEGVTTANGLMLYVYDKVGNDPSSNQTPAFGSLEGDGDFIFEPLMDALAPTKINDAILVQIPKFGAADESILIQTNAHDTLKQYLSLPENRIRLDDFITNQLRKTVPLISLEKFPANSALKSEEFVNRIERYETAVSDILNTVILFGKWSTSEQLPLLSKIFARLAEVDKGSSGLNIWLNLGWYPILILMYGAGISAIAEGRYDTLKICLLSSITTGKYDTSVPKQPVILSAISAIWESPESFKLIPGLEQRHTPISDHLFQVLQPVLEDLLFIGKSYEALFDEFEIILALVFADLRAGEGVDHVWGPPGRFGWKTKHWHGDNPYNDVLTHANASHDNWGPIKAGLFNGSYARFNKISGAYKTLLGTINWW